MGLAGWLKHLHSENRRIERVIEAEFENIEPEEWADGRDPEILAR